MATAREIESLHDEERRHQEKVDELNTWLVDHTTHPDFEKIARDRNHFAQQVRIVQYKIYQLKHNLPVLGDDLGPNVNYVNIKNARK